MFAVVFLLVLLVLVSTWLWAEMRARPAARIAIGGVCLMAVAAGWFFAELRMAQIDALHQACFGEMGAALGSGDIERVKHAISMYNAPKGDSLRVFQALDVMNGKTD